MESIVINIHYFFNFAFCKKIVSFAQARKTTTIYTRDKGTHEIWGVLKGLFHI